MSSFEMELEQQSVLYVKHAIPLVFKNSNVSNERGKRVVFSAVYKE